MAFNPSSSLARLLDAPVRPGRLVWIGLRPERRADMQLSATAQLHAGHGLEGDRYAKAEGARQVTLIGVENLDAIAAFLGREAIAPELVRRNLVVGGINLLALKGRRFTIGQATLEATGECHPCSRMEQVLGTGGYNAMRGQGGITAKVIEGGSIHIGDEVARLQQTGEAAA